jgi:hypothetical protein
VAALSQLNRQAADHVAQAACMYDWASTDLMQAHAAGLQEDVADITLRALPGTIHRNTQLRRITQGAVSALTRLAPGRNLSSDEYEVKGVGWHGGDVKAAVVNDQ